MTKLSGLLIAGFCLFLFASVSPAQTTEFTFQGSLRDASNLANGSYDLEFALYDSPSGGNQNGPTVDQSGVAVVNGLFAVKLDFGSQFPGANRYLEIRVKVSGQPNFTTLSPRQIVNSSPYSIKSLSADAAISAQTSTTANDAVNLGGVPSGQYVKTGDSRLSDARNPLPGSGSYIQNATSPQTANFSINGSGSVASLGVTGPITFSAFAAPALAPAGQSRVYFDLGTNKLRISENGSAYANLVGASGISGGGTLNSIPVYTAANTLGNSLITQSSGAVQLPAFVSLATGGTQGNNVTFGSPNGETGLTIAGSSPGRADLRFDGAALKLVAGPSGGPPSENFGIAVTTAGNVGIGTVAPQGKLEVNPGGSGGALRFYAPNGESGMSIVGANRADVRFDGSTLKLLAGTGAGVPSNGIVINTGGNVGIGTFSPVTKLALSGGPTWTTSSWTGSLSLANASAMGWEANASGQHFGIGQTTGGLYFFRTNSALNSTVGGATYDMQITDTGNIIQPIAANGLVKAMLFIEADGTIIRCYNGLTNTSSGSCGFSVNKFASTYTINFGFQASNRFATASPGQSGNALTGLNIEYGGGGPNTIRIITFVQGNNAGDASFTIVVY